MPHPRTTRPSELPSLTSSVDAVRTPTLRAVSVEPDAYRLIVELMRDAAVVMSFQGNVLYSNHSLSTMLGLPTDQITGSNMRRFVLPDDLPRFNTLLREARMGTARSEIRLCADNNVTVATHLSVRGFESDCVAVIEDVGQRHEHEAERLELVSRLMDVEEIERRRVARELHDQFGQQLSALTLKLANLRRDRGRRTQFSAQLEPLESIAKQLGADLDLLVSRLRPPPLDDLGLLAALDHYVQRWSEEFGIHADLHAHGLEAGGLSIDMETALYRIVQEALNNVAKHSQARNVAILLEQSTDRVSLIVEDDGVGFNAEQRFQARRFGVTGMRERTALLAGTFDIESSPGHGTAVAVRIPLPNAGVREP